MADSRARRRRIAAAALILFAVPILIEAQRGGDPAARNPEYDGSFTFTRIRYGGGGGFRRGGASWAHDYPAADLNLPRILEFVSTARVRTGASNVLDLEDPGIFRNPVLYISEPGFWTLSEEGVRNLRAHLLKGGLLILDDFERGQWHNMAEQLRRALPEYEPIEIGPDHPIFHVFFDIEDIYIPHPLVDVTPNYFGLFEDNDPSRRMLAMINHDSDLAEYWEWADEGWFPVDLSNEAYKFGVNYILWAMTH